MVDAQFEHKKEKSPADSRALANVKQLVLIFLVVYAITRFFETFWKRKKVRGKIIAAYTLPLIVGTYVSMYLFVFWEWTKWDILKVSNGAVYTGIAMVLLSAVTRNWAIRTLGLYHSIQIEIRDRHELIQSGPYKFIRNPYYLSNIIEALGLPLIVSSRSAFLFSVLVYIPNLLLRMMLEERALEEKFPKLFAAYKSRVPRILPRLTYGAPVKEKPDQSRIG